MNKEIFLEKLEKNGINKKMVCFDDNVSDDIFCVMTNNNYYEVYYRERGKEYYNRRFNNQDEALEYLLEYLCRIAKYI